MPDSLFSHRPLRRGRLAVMVAGSLVFHCALVGLAAIWPAPKSYNLPDPVTEIGLDDKLGEEVQKLVVPEDAPTPPPDSTPEPTPPPDEAETPPPTEDPDMTEPEATPSPPPKPKAPRPAATPAPANAKRGAVARPGQVDGNVDSSTRLTGTPGGSKIGQGWKLPKPNYPYQARASRVQGSGSVRVSTSASGNVISATIVQSAGSGVLDSNTIQFAKSNWSGPPNATTTVPITYKLQ